MEKLPSDLINIPRFELLQPSDASYHWEIEQLVSQVLNPTNVCPQIPYIPEPPEPSLPIPASMESRTKHEFSIREALQQLTNTEPQEVCKYPKEHLIAWHTEGR